MFRSGGVALSCLLAWHGCTKKQDDATIEKRLVGIWSFNPREQVPQEKIDNEAFETPSQVVLQFDASKVDEKGSESASYAMYEHIPKLVHSTDHWKVTRGTWFVAQGKVILQGSYDVELKVLSAAPRQLRVDHFPLIPCNNDNCVLLPLSSLPEGTATATGL